jgi:dUTP pyrophosphatase
MNATQLPLNLLTAMPSMLDMATLEDATGRWSLLVLPGGAMPVLGTEGAAALDLCTRAIVDVMPDERNPAMRKTLFDFEKICDSAVKPNIEKVNGKKVYMLRPGEKVRIGVGIVIEIPSDQVAYIHPRGSTSNREIDVTREDGCIDVKNGGVPIDSDFRGEPSAILHNVGKQPFIIERHQRIVQLVRYPLPCAPLNDRPRIVMSLDELTRTKRGYHQNGSTGFMYGTRAQAT